MRRKIKMKPQEFVATIVQAMVTTFLTAKGIDQSSAEFTGSCIGGIVKGLSLADKNPADPIRDVIKKAVENVISNSDITLPYDCYELLKDSFVASNMIWEYLCAPGSKEALRKHVIRVCNQSVDCDTTTLQVNEIVEDIMLYLDEAILQNPELQLHTIYQWVRKQNSQPMVYMANENYVQSFIEPLFLHKGKNNPKVNLVNLFVMQKYRDSDEIIHNDLENRLARFINSETTNLLFIEGDGGSGKTTLVAWMNYHYSVSDRIAEKLYKDRPLITIRLRDLKKRDVVENKDILFAVRNYMKVPSLDELELLYPNAVVILDGFDELCMIEGLHDYEELIYNIVRSELKGFKFIITTRPKFVYRDIICKKLQYELHFPVEFIYLQHFDQEKRREWLEHYTSPDYCGESIENHIKEYILGIDTDSNSCISDTPMTLYMLVAKDTTTEMLNNNWYLYHHIFYYDLNETEYNRMIPDPNRRYSHNISQIREVIYQVSEEIAYCMYMWSNQNFYLRDETLHSIIQQLSDKNEILKDVDTQAILERSYALCCYWKTNSDRGAVEFLHNNIRDFFLAEKIYRSINELIMNSKGSLELERERKKRIISSLCALFQYGILETKVTEFILLRATYYANRDDSNFAKIEYQKHILSNIVDEMISDKKYYKELLSCQYEGDLLQLIVNIITCTVQICRYANEPYLGSRSKIPWKFGDWISIIFRQVFSQVPVTLTSDSMITLASRGKFENLRLKGCDLRNIGFQYSVMSESDLSDTILCGCDFTSSNLDAVDFTNADMHYACLKSAKLTNCTFTGVDLRGTDLPDGFCSMDQDEQIQHLKSLNIHGLRI